MQEGDGMNDQEQLGTVGSRSASPMEREDANLPTLNSSRGVEEHRVDPALRQALDKLDALRSSQPSLEDFAFENYLGQRPVVDVPAVTGEGRGSASSSRRSAGRRHGYGQGANEPFSLDLLMAAALSGSTINSSLLSQWEPVQDGGRASDGYPWPASVPARNLGPLMADSSRSTTPGSAFSTSVDSFSSATTTDPLARFSAQKAAPRPPRVPAAPSIYAPSGPRRPGARPRPDSARSRRRIQAAVESAAADLAAYTTAPHSAR